MNLKMRIIVLDILVVGVEAGQIIIWLFVHDKSKSHALFQYVGVKTSKRGAVSTVNKPARKAEITTTKNVRIACRGVCASAVTTYLFLYAGERLITWILSKSTKIQPASAALPWP